MVNVALDLKRIRLKFVLETINRYKVITVANINFTFSFINKIRIPRTLVWRTYLIKYSQKLW